ncbi:molecular chaperone GrpE (heat shock protein) [Spiroplasma gladiatoris]|uniref:Protein GrpE n=1 Tax=Spiroplasma gladiatoris TaxID=2143 RepID=A0A4P7AH97_9MOLU|nr:nucleotide exchange factor GrpE [Spiroplasma gladiatoris]QBQ07552.1 molecular chaperone GrpE (heat shock protein) [Spiroplasma gladiatoris]
MKNEEYKKVFDLIESLKKQLNNGNNNEDENDQNKTKDKKQKTQNDSEEKQLTDIELLELEFVNLVEKNEELQEAKLMAIADNQNTVRRYQNESAAVKKYGGEKLASELLPAIDMFRSVLKTSPDNPEVKNYLMGFEMIMNQIDHALTNAGLNMIVTKIGDDLDPSLHNAIDQIEAENVKTGQIAMIVSNGYKLHDRVIKHAVVKVAK